MREDWIRWSDVVTAHGGADGGDMVMMPTSGWCREQKCFGLVNWVVLQLSRGTTASCDDELIMVNLLWAAGICTRMVMK